MKSEVKTISLRLSSNPLNLRQALSTSAIVGGVPLEHDANSAIAKPTDAHLKARIYVLPFSQSKMLMQFGIGLSSPTPTTGV